MAKAEIDWEAVEVHYRAGIRSLKDIGAQFGVSDAGIVKRAKRDGWVRDLKAKIRAKADAKVSAAAVSAEVSAQTKITEALTIEVEATVQARIQLGHRRDIGRSRELTMKLLDELDAQTANPELMEQLAVMVAGPKIEGNDPADKMAEAMRKRMLEAFDKAMSLGNRVDIMKKLADAMKTLVALEREAYHIGADDDGNGGGNYESFMDQI